MSTDPDRKLNEEFLKTKELLNELDDLLCDDDLELLDENNGSGEPSPSEEGICYIDEMRRPLEFLRPGKQQQSLSIEYLKQVSGALSRAVRQDDPQLIPFESISAFSVFPGDLIACCVEEASLFDVNTRRVRLSWSNHFIQNSHGDIIANRYGYLLLEKNTLSIVSPIILDKLNLNVFWLLLDRRPVSFQKEWLDAWWKDRRIKVAPDTFLLEQQIQAMTTATNTLGTLLLARGQAPEQGRDAKIELSVDLEKNIGLEKKDGSIDFHEVNFVTNAVADQEIAIRIPPTPGGSGTDVFGNTLPARNGKDHVLHPGDGVWVDSANGKEIFYAKHAGAIRYHHDTLSITQVLILHKGVNFETGNINFNGDVFVDGDIMPGFSVTANGDISVNGSVDNNVLITSGQSVAVSRGILGPRTVISAKENIRAQFIQGGRLAAGGQVALGSFAYHSRIRAGESVTVNCSTDPRSGSIIGGEVSATEFIDADTAGTPIWETTELSVGFTSEQAEVLERLQIEIENYSRHIRQLLDFFGMNRIDPKAIRKQIERAKNEAEKKCMTLRAKQLGIQAKNYQVLLQKRDQFVSKLGPGVSGAYVKLRKIAYPGVIVRIGSHRKAFADEVKRLKLKLVDNEIKTLSL